MATASHDPSYGNLAKSADLIHNPQHREHYILIVQRRSGQIEQCTNPRPLSKSDSLLATVSPSISDIHPSIVGMYRQKVAPLGEALEKPQERDAAASAIRGLNERIVLVPGTEGGDLQVTLQGDFGAILRMDGKRGQNRIDRHSRLANVGLGGSGGGTRTPGPRIMIPLL